VNFKDYFPNPEVSILNRNYRSSKEIVDMSNTLISYNKKQVKKKAHSVIGQAQQPIFIELTEKLGYSFRTQIPNYYNLIKTLLSNGVKPSEIMVLSRFNRTLKDLEEHCGARGIPTEYKAGGIRFHSAHGSKGLESTHVIIMNAISGLYGFPCEILDSSVLELAKRFVTDSYFEEERRLFYVALTRSKKFLYVYSLEAKNSMFLNEINPYLMNVFIDTGERWRQGLSEFFSSYIKELSLDFPMICPKCGRLLTERIRRVDGHKFIGCTGFHSTGCKFTFDLETYTENQDERILFEEKPILNNEMILQAVSSEWHDLIYLKEKLNIKDELDFGYLKNKLNEFERKNFVQKKIFKKQVFWKSSLNEKKSSKETDLSKDNHINISRLINKQSILRAVSFEWRNLNYIIQNLNIKKKSDITYLKNKLGEFERKKYITKIRIEGQEYWKKG
jgi:DNA helicase-4